LEEGGFVIAALSFNRTGILPQSETPAAENASKHPGETRTARRATSVSVRERRKELFDIAEIGWA